MSNHHSLYFLGPFDIVNNSYDTLNFFHVEDKPLFEKHQAILLAVVASFILIIGVLVQARISTMLHRRSDHFAAIDRLFLANNTVSFISHQPLLLYFISNFFLFPMSDYIGLIGCTFIMHFLDVYIRVYSLYFPLSIALLRYIFVVHHGWARSVGIKRVVYQSIAISLLIPLFMTITVQFPIADFIHGPFYHCIGRFEVYFDPKHSDPFTPGIKHFYEYNCKCIPP